MRYKCIELLKLVTHLRDGVILQLLKEIRSFSRDSYDSQEALFQGFVHTNTMTTIHTNWTILT